jgi:hypothetical protein
MLTADQRELALSRRHVMKREELMRATKELEPLVVGTVVSVENQTGPSKLKWDKSGVILEVLPCRQYKVKMDGSGRVSLRNRVYLMAIVPYKPETRREEEVKIKVTEVAVVPEVPVPVVPEEVGDLQQN